MPIEQRVIGGGQKIGGGKIGGGATAKEAPAPEPEVKKKGKKGLLIGIIAGVLVLGGAAAYYFLGMAGGGDEAAEEPAPEPGAVIAVEPISLNLAQGHYLRLGFSLQMTVEAAGHGDPDTSKAVDAAIDLFSNRTVAEVSDTAVRDQLKADFLHQLEELYHGEVMDVYWTNYVTQ